MKTHHNCKPIDVENSHCKYTIDNWAIQQDGLDQNLAGLSLGPKISPGKLMKTHHNCKPIDVKTAIVSILEIIGPYSKMVLTKI